MLYRLIFYFTLLSIFGWSCTKPKVSKSTHQKLGSEVLPAEKTVVTLANNPILREDLLRDFENSPNLDSSSNEDLIQELVQKKLFIKEAKALKMDTSEIFKEEVETYRKIEIQHYLEDKVLLSKLASESYERYKTEINASHIFIPMSWYASPEDTLKLYRELLELRKYALKNKNFEVLAKEWSKDNKTNSKGGSLGWFTAFNLIYPLEQAAYTTQTDSISLPIKTKAGYHLVKVNHIRKNSGYVKVKHIVKYLKPDITNQEYEIAYKTLDSLQNLIKDGASFDTFVQQYSDDFNSRETNGLLPTFGIGTREESNFEEAAFSLAKGEVSKPVRTGSGLHLIMLIEKYKPDSKEVYISKIQPKLTTDSRAEYLQMKKLEELKKKNHFDLNQEIFAQCLNYADERILERNWQPNKNELSTFVLFKIEKKNFLVSDFFKFVTERQSYEKWRAEEKPVEIFKMLLDKFVNQQLILLEEKYIQENNKDLERLMKSQVDNLIYSKFYNKMIIEKSLDDSTGQINYYKRHPEEFPKIEIGTLTVVSFVDSMIYNKFKEIRTKPKPFQLNRGIKPLYFAKNQYELDLEEKRKLMSLLTIMRKNPGFIVEVGGHVDKNEDEKTAELRIKQIVDFLVENGLPLTRILEVNYKNNRVEDRFDWSKNQRVTFQFFSNLESDLYKIFNEKQPDSIVFKSYSVEKGEFERKMGLKWQSQTGIIQIESRTEEFSLKIKNTTKSFKDYKFDVIQKYQLFLSKELIESLAKKYNLGIDKTELVKLIEEVKSNSK